MVRKNQNSSFFSYLVALLGTFLIGAMLLFMVHIIYEGRIIAIDEEIEKHRAHIQVGDIILLQINNIEKMFYRVATLRNIHKRKILCTRVKKHSRIIQRAFEILRRGGRLTVLKQLNLGHHSSIHKAIISVAMTDNKQRNYLIELEGKLNQIIQRLSHIEELAEERDLLAVNSFSAAYKIKINELKLFLKLSAAYFLRAQENINQIYFDEKIIIDNLKMTVKQKKSAFLWAEFAIVMAILFIVSICVSLLVRQMRKTSQELLRSKKKAEDATRIKSQFLANMSHEIRTPMNSVIGRTLLALDSNPGPEMKDHLNAIHGSGENLLQIINDVLDFSKIEAGKLAINDHSFNLHELIVSCVDSMKSFASNKRKNISLRYTIAQNVSRVVVGDELRLKQILLNLLSNGVKFTDHGYVLVAVKKIEVSGNKGTQWIEFQVEDTGKGIAEKYHKDIFEQFSQEDATITRKHGGTGLGLSICQHLVELMGGKIEVKSLPGKGSCFTFSLPFQTDLGEALAPTKEALENLQQAERSYRTLTIFIVDDNRSNRTLGKLMVQKMGEHLVLEAGNGLDALALLLDYRPDMIFMDVQMPIMDGYATTKIIRACEQKEAITDKVDEQLLFRLRNRLKGCHIPIIAMTANALQGDKETSLEAGMDDYLSKPFTPDDFTAMLYKFR